MLRKWMNGLWVACIVAVLSGCNVLDTVNESLDYTNEAGTYINEASQFAQSLPELARQAATDPQAKEALTQELEQMKNRIAEFNGLEAPALAQSIHEQLTSLNDTLLTDINGYMEQIQNGVTEFQNSGIMQTIDKINETMNLLENLQP